MFHTQYTDQHIQAAQNSTDLPARLRSVRGERSQEEFARLVGLTRSAVAYYENGRTVPKPPVLRQISQRIGIADDYLLSGLIRNEYELNLVATGRGFLNECHETADELAMVRALRAVEPSTVQAVVGVLIKDIGDNASTRVKLGPSLGSDLQALDSIHRAGGHFDKGVTAEEHHREARAPTRRALGLKP